MLILIHKAKTLALGALLLCLGTSTAFAFGKRPIIPIPVPPPVDVITARWDNVTRDGASWSQYVFKDLSAQAPNLLSNPPADIASFCPAYPKLSVGDKTNFWVYLVSSIAELESNFDPTSVYTENFNDNQGNPVQSVGLLQVSLGDASIYNCTFRSKADVENPDANLDCGLRILNKLVGADRRISGQSGSAWRGGARYWSTLRDNKLAQVQSWTNALPMCAQ